MASRTSRRTFLATSGALATAGLLGHRAQAATSAASGLATSADAGEYSRPVLAFANADRQHLLGTQYEAALTNLIDINTVHADPEVYNSSGLISYPPGTFVQAGREYPPPQRWTRDNAVNAWNAASLLSPVVGENTLWAAVDRQADGSLIVRQDTQWWDHIIWVPAAWHHYKLTGDREFLANAYKTSVNSLNARRTNNFNRSYGLFEGPGFMNDGIAGYPSPPYDPSIGSGFVLRYPGADKLMCLSTNCEYYGAYLTLAAMAKELGRFAEAASYRRDGAVLRHAINRRLWRKDAGTYGYFIHGAGELAGQLDTFQEGGGLAFAGLFGVASPSQVRRLLATAHLQPHGMVNVWPHFERFSDEQPGRHNVMVWPMVHSMYGHAAAVGGRVDLFARAVTDLANLADSSDSSFFELYNSLTGAVDGGWQVGRQWSSKRDQAWSATGYLRMIYFGLFGLKLTPDQLTIAPTLPPGWGPVSLSGVPYRAMTLDIELSGAGNVIRRCTVDGRPGRPTLPADRRGTHTVRIELR
jgi:hypothetical protein